MKKLMLITAITFTLMSCGTKNKDYVCECHIAGTGQIVMHELNNYTMSDAYDSCYQSFGNCTLHEK